MCSFNSIHTSLGFHRLFVAFFSALVWLHTRIECLDSLLQHIVWSYNHNPNGSDSNRWWRQRNESLITLIKITIERLATRFDSRCCIGTPPELEGRKFLIRTSVANVFETSQEYVHKHLAIRRQREMEATPTSTFLKPRTQLPENFWQKTVFLAKTALKPDTVTSHACLPATFFPK